MSRSLTPVPGGIAPGTTSDIPPELVEQLRAALRGLRFGSIELTVHEGAVVQIERREKVRITLKGP